MQRRTSKLHPIVQDTPQIDQKRNQISALHGELPKSIEKYFTIVAREDLTASETFLSVSVDSVEISRWVAITTIILHI